MISGKISERKNFSSVGPYSSGVAALGNCGRFNFPCAKMHFSCTTGAPVKFPDPMLSMGASATMQTIRSLPIVSQPWPDDAELSS